nr:hypothetical protein CFP56_19535 [Quercus suber]
MLSRSESDDTGAWLTNATGGDGDRFLLRFRAIDGTSSSLDSSKSDSSEAMAESIKGDSVAGAWRTCFLIRRPDLCLSVSPKSPSPNSLDKAVTRAGGDLGVYVVLAPRMALSLVGGKNVVWLLVGAKVVLALVLAVVGLAVNWWQCEVKVRVEVVVDMLSTVKNKQGFVNTPSQNQGTEQVR